MRVVQPDDELFHQPLIFGLYPAEAYHQNYATLHPDSGYIAHFDLPKVNSLKNLFPDVYREAPVLVGESTRGGVR